MTTGGSPDDEAGMIERGMIERLEAGEPPSSPEEAQARAPYERLLARIRDLEDIAPPEGWEDRAVQRWAGAQRRRRLGLALGGAAMAAAAVAAVLLLRPRAAPPLIGLEVKVSPEPGSSRRGEGATVGEVLHVRGGAEEPHLELRVYLQNRLIARCPGSAECRRDGAVMALDWKLGEAGKYEILLFSSASDIPAGNGTLDGDQVDAQRALVHIEQDRLTVAP